MKFELQQRSKIFLYFLCGIAIPCLLLSYFALRGIQNDRALLEKQTRERYKHTSQVIIENFHQQIFAVEDSCRKSIQAIPNKLDAEAISSLSKLKNIFPPIKEFFFVNSPAQIKFPITRLLYTPDNKSNQLYQQKKPSVVSNLISDAQQYEFRDKDFKKAITIYRRALNRNIYSKYLWLKKDIDSETIRTRFQPPDGFQRVSAPPSSFGHWLRNLPLLPDGTPVKDYQGRIKVSAKDTTLAAVINYDIRGMKLEQCIDIILRFWAEYLLSQQKSDEIAFYLPISFLLKWNDWKQGLRPHYQGIQINLVKNHPPDSSRASFEEYLREIFYHSNTQSAYFNYPKVKFEDVQIGDFIVKKGSRGHAVLIVDLAVDENGNKIALIGQGDTPARHFYLLNFKNHKPWFRLNRNNKYPPLPIKKKMYWEGLRRFFIKNVKLNLW